ncbi:MAG: hypothetical protein RLY77_821, partial [Pseudomonadota bacterium]
FHAHHAALARHPRQWQGEIAQPAEQIQHALTRLHIKQVQRTRNHRLIEFGVDLDEIQRAEIELDLPLRQLERQLRRLPIERMHRIQPTRLQEDVEIMCLRKRGQGLLVVVRQRLQMTKHQYGGGITRDEFNLRDVAAAIHAIHQRAQRIQLEPDLRHQRMALAQIGHEAWIGFAEAHQGFVFFLDPAHRQPPLAPIPPAIAPQRRQHTARCHMADALQILQQHALLGFNLLVFGQMLQHAAGAHPKMRAPRLHAIG